MAGKLSDELSLFIENTFAYIPYAVIGIFILLTATFTSVYLLKIDSEVAETIYTTENNNPRQNAINLAFSTLLMGTLNLLLVVALQCLLRNLQRILRRRNSDF